MEYKAAAVAKGVKLYIADYTRPTIPDEENYAAAPIFVELTDARTDKKALQRLALPDGPLTYVIWYSRNRDILKIYQKIFIRNGWIPSATDNPAEDVLTALERLALPLSEIRKVFPRSQSQWPLIRNQVGNLEFPYQTPLRDATNAFVLRARALIALHRPAEALDEIRHAFRASQSLGNEPGLLPFDLRLGILRKALYAAEQGIASNRWRDVDLRILASECGNFDVFGGLVRALDSERAIGNQHYEILAGNKYHLAKLLSGSRPVPAPAAILVSYTTLTGRVRFDQVEYNHLIDLDIEDIDAVEATINARFSRSAEITTGYSVNTWWRTHFRTTFVASGNRSMVFRAASAHTRAQQLVTECALARYRQQHGGLPASLEALVPEFLDRVPHDVMDGQPLRYRRTDEGGCLIWSIGENRIDDGGDPNLPDGPPSHRKTTDWVSELPPISRQ